MPGLDVMRSKSVPQLSSIELIFKPGTDLLDARQLVANGWRRRPDAAELGDAAGHDPAPVGHEPDDEDRPLVGRRWT